MEMTAKDVAAIEKIGKRVMLCAPKNIDQMNVIIKSIQTVSMLGMIHENVEPLNLEALSECSFGNLFDDLYDMEANFDPATMTFNAGFVPKYALKNESLPVDIIPQTMENLDIHNRDGLILIGRHLFENAPEGTSQEDAAGYGAKACAVLMVIHENIVKLDFSKLYALPLVAMLAEIAAMLASFDPKTLTMDYVPTCAAKDPSKVEAPSTDTIQ